MNLRNNVNNILDLSDLIERVKDKYKNIYIFQFEDQVFVYHSVGRKDYKNLLANGELDEQEKEETLYNSRAVKEIIGVRGSGR